MSIFSKLIALFSRKEPDTITPEVHETRTESSNPPIHIDESVLYIYSHGFSNGVYRVEPGKESFQEFLRANSDAEKIAELRRINDRMLFDARQQLLAKRNASKTIQDLFIERKESVGHLQNVMTEIDQSRAVVQEKQQALVAQRDTTHA